ncbi:hypothetical protein M1O51_05115 [Dehalococcoidia bacterium]|nr:hypothetical protein [Dehalococcoidia bacterium]
MTKTKSWPIKALHLVMALLLGASFSLVAAPPVEAAVTEVTITSPTTAEPASVQSGGIVNVRFDVTTNVAGLGEIYIRIGPAANPIGSLGPFSFSFVEGQNKDLTYSIAIAETAAEGLYEVFVEARQPPGVGTWESDLATNAVRVDNTAPPGTTVSLTGLSGSYKGRHSNP